MQAWDVVIVGGSIASLRAAIAAADEGATVTILTQSSTSAFVDDVTSCGLAASSGETNPSGHAADARRVHGEARHWWLLVGPEPGER